MSIISMGCGYYQDQNPLQARGILRHYENSLLIMKSIVRMHSCTPAYAIRHFNRA